MAELQFCNASGLLAPRLEAEVRAGIWDAVTALASHADLSHVGIVVHLSEMVGREIGLGGHAYGPDSCAIHVDPGCAALAQDTRRNAAAIAIHELHHVLRARHYRWLRFADLCAGEILALEGLATRCELFLGYPEPLNVRDWSGVLTQEYLARVAPIVGDPAAEWQWIYQLGEFPASVYRAVYPMGHRVVGAYLARSGLSPIEALGVPWEDIWQAGSEAELA